MSGQSCSSGIHLNDNWGTSFAMARQLEVQSLQSSVSGVCIAHPHDNFPRDDGSR